MSKNVHVIYVGNSDPSNRTDELLLDTERGNLVLNGDAKELTIEELHSFQRYGVQLKIVNADGSDLAESLTVEELKAALETAGESFKASDSKETLVKKYEAVQGKSEEASEPKTTGSNQSTTPAGSSTTSTGTV